MVEVALDFFSLQPEFDFSLALSECGPDTEARKLLEENQARYATLIQKMEAGEGTIALVSEIREVLASSESLARLSRSAS